MKKKKILAVLLCMLMCVFSLTACTPTQQKVTDESISSSLTSEATSFVEQIVGFDDAALAQYIEYYGIDGQSPDAGKLSGLVSWDSNRDDLGAYISTDNVEVLYDSANKYYIVVASLTFEKRGCEFRMIVDKQLSGISSMTFNPSFTLGEKMGKAAMNTVMGIATVFLMLILISLIIYCFRFIPMLEEKLSKKKNPAPAAPAPVQAAPVQAEEEEELADDLELVAVITAAIAASEGTSADGLVVRSIRRANTNKWRRA